MGLWCSGHWAVSDSDIVGWGVQRGTWGSGPVERVLPIIEHTDMLRQNPTFIIFVSPKDPNFEVPYHSKVQ